MKVVLNLLPIVNGPKRHLVYFDNFFSSYAFLNEKMKFRTIEFVWKSATEKYPIMDDKKLREKREGLRIVNLIK